MDITDVYWDYKTSEYETEGYWFDGEFFVTEDIRDVLSKEEILFKKIGDCHLNNLPAISPPE